MKWYFVRSEAADSCSYSSIFGPRSSLASYFGGPCNIPIFAMAEEAATPVAATTPKKGKKAGGASKPKKTKTLPSHPKVSVMVPAAIGALKERGGSSLQAIKKYVAANYKVDVERLAPFIKKYLKSAVETGALLQTKGKGASGSFKLKGATSEARPVKAKKTSTPKPKKAAAAKKPSAAKKPKAAKKAKTSPKKAAKKPSPTKPKPAKKAAKPKAPKPKKAKSPAKRSGKK